MSENNLKIASTAEDVRLCVIENSIFVEELASNVLGNILNIDWKNSKSFGHGSTCLSFNQKLQLIQDIKGVSKEDLKAIYCLAQMRNKFAHVSHIDSFEKLFSDPMGTEIKNYFFRRFFDEMGMSDIPIAKIELIYRLCFYLLVHDVIEALLKINNQHFFDKGYEAGLRETKDKLLDAFSKLVDPLQQLIILQSLQDVKDEMQTDTHNLP